MGTNFSMIGCRAIGSGYKFLQGWLPAFQECVHIPIKLVAGRSEVGTNFCNVGCRASLEWVQFFIRLLAGPL